MAIKDILRVANDIQAANLVGHNLKSAKKKNKNLTKLGVENIISTNLIRVNAQLIEGY